MAPKRRSGDAKPLTQKALSAWTTAPPHLRLVKRTLELEGKLLGSEAQRVEDVTAFTVRHDGWRAEQRSSRAASGVEVAIIIDAELSNDLHRLPEEAELEAA